MSSSAIAPAPVDRLPLLRRLTQEVPGWGVWKNTHAAVAGHGDVDSAASRDVWPAIEEAFADWARLQGLGPVVICRHVPDGLLLLAVDRRRGIVHELDVAASQPLRGWPLFSAGRLSALMTVDARGVRRLRPGAEGLLLMLLAGLRHGGRPDVARLEEKGIGELLRTDPEGAAMAAELLGTARGPALALARAVQAGGWNRVAALAIEARNSLRALLSPAAIAARTRYRLVSPRCPVNRVLRSRRRLPDDVDAWLADCARAHRIVEAA